LLFFDSSGYLERQVGREGSGPGEFATLTALSRTYDGAFAAYDIRQRRFSFVDSSGVLVRSLLIRPTGGVVQPPTSLGLLSDGTVLLRPGAFELGADGPPRIERSEDSLLRYHPDRQELSLFGAFPGTEYVVAPMPAAPNGGPTRYARIPREFGLATGYAFHADHVIVADNTRFELRWFDSGGTLEQIVRKEHSDTPVTSDMVSSLRRLQLSGVRNPAVRERAEKAMADRPAPSARTPAFDSQIFVDLDGRLWVPEYLLPDASERRWWVFHQDGLLSFVLRASAAYQIKDAAGDRVYSLRRGHDGVELVEVFAIEW